jgi:hypothetical protein
MRFFSKDPEPGIDDDVAPADVIGGGIEVADGAVGGDDLETDQVSGLRPGLYLDSSRGRSSRSPPTFAYRRNLISNGNSP